MPPRGATADCLCTTAGWTLETLPEGARVGTGSPRRAAQLLRVRPDLSIVPIRGNIERRLRYLEEPVLNTPIGSGSGSGDGSCSDTPLDAVVLAEAGLQRLAARDTVADTVLRYISQRLPFLPSPAQGALALEVRMDTTPAPLRQALLAINHQPTLLAAIAERALLRTLHALSLIHI